jgi:ubiquinone/menaquinone biosynthesis C-methylase UbiE
MIKPFPEIYTELRKKEGRVFHDEDVRNLPDVKPGHPHAREWKIRKRTAQWLMKTIREKHHSPRILEVGCGNGWLSAYLSNISHSDVTGIDINTDELEQAKKVFKDRRNLKFISSSLPDTRLGKNFDIILFAASIQYFPDFSDILDPALQLLSPGGVIFITDSVIYPEHEVANARARSKTYFHSMDMPGMTHHYFHHTLKELDRYSYSILKDPGHFLNRFVTKDPFYRICIFPNQ